MIGASSHHLDNFVKLLKDTQIPDNTQRTNAESQLRSIEAETKTNMLLQVLLNEKDTQIIEVACVFLRQIITKSRIFRELTPQTVANMKNTLPQLCLQQQSDKIRRKMADIISSLITTCSKDAQTKWSEGNHFFYECLVRSNHTVGKEIGMRILQITPKLYREFNNECISNIFNALTEILSGNPEQHCDLIIEASKTLFYVLSVMKYKKAQKFSHNAFTVVFHLLKNCRVESIVTEILENLAMLIEFNCNTLKDVVVPLIDSLLGLLISQTTVDSVRTLVMECIASISENLKNFRTLAKDLLPTIVEIYVRHICLQVDEVNWITSTKVDEEDDEDSIPRIAETSLDRITCAVKGKYLYPVIMDKISPLLTSNVWQHRVAALTTISCIAEGCLKQMKLHLQQIVEVVVPFIRDEHPRVVYCSINAIGQLATDYRNHFQSTFHQHVFPAILFAATNYSQYPRLQAHAVCCFVNLIQGCPQDILLMYSDQMAQILQTTFVQTVNEINKPGYTIVLENVLSSLGTFAEALNDKFSKYYKILTPTLITLARSFSTTLHTDFYINCLETLAAIFTSVGRNECLHDMDAVLEILQSFEIQSIKPRESDRNFKLEYLEILSNMASVFGDSMHTILPKLVPSTLEIIAEKTTNELILSSLNDEDNDDETLSKAFAAHTDIIQDKSNACLIVDKLFQNMNSSMINYIDQILPVLLECYSDAYDEYLSKNLCDLFPLILSCSEQKGTNYVLKNWAIIFNSLTIKLSKSNEFVDCSSSITSLSDCINIVSFNGLSNEVLLRIVEVFSYLFKYLIVNVADIDSGGIKFNDNSDCEDGEDGNDADDLNSSSCEEDEEFEEVLSSLQQLNNTLFKLLKNNYFPYFSLYFEDIVKLLHTQSQLLRSWAPCFVSDLIEFSPNESLQLFSQIEDNIKALLHDQSPSVKQSSVYLVGVMAEFAPQYYQVFISHSLQLIVSMITDPKSKDEDNISLTCNAIAIIGRIMKYSPNLISPFETAVTTWISWLPVTDDEVDFILSYLLDLFESKFQLVAGPNNSTLGKSLDSVASMIAYVIDDDISKRAITMLSQLRVHMPDFFESWYLNLNVVLKNNIEHVQSYCQT